MKSISKSILKAYNNNKKGILKVYAELRKRNFSDIEILKYLLKNAGCKNIQRANGWTLGQISSNLIKLSMN